MNTHMTITERKMGRAINRLRFKSKVWNKLASYEFVYGMVNDVRKAGGLDPMSKEMFNEGIQYCRIFSSYYKYALEEFKALCWGDW